MTPPTSKRVYGIAMVTAASLFWSTAGLFVRLLHVDVWTMMAWRSLFASLALAAVVLLQHGPRTPAVFRAIGWPGLAAIPISALSMFCYVAALELTSVANVLTVYATVPFVAAGIAFVWMGERVERRVLVASGMALLGILVMVGAATSPHDIAGNALAFLMTLTFGIMLVLARRHPSIGMAAVNALAAGLCALVCWPLSSAPMPDAGQLMILAAFGTVTTALAYLMFLTGGRHIPSGEAGLIALLDVVLGPLWVWLAFAERPATAAIVGGAIVLGAVAWYLADGLGHSRQ